MKPDIEKFVRDFLKDIQQETAAVFAGAGLSVAAGYVDWRELLRPIAEDLGVDIEHETDLVALAQFHCNENGGNRHKLNELLLDRIPEGTEPTEGHKILARLPITTYWTTNYDRLIESALRSVGKTADAKSEVPQLATTRVRRDAVVYKMHGDMEHPSTAVLTKDDFERFHLNRGAFTTALAGDLVSKTFLFLGFSFTDPNLDRVLGRIRETFKENQRTHYCFFKKRTRKTGEAEQEFRNAETRQRLVVRDLLRYNIKTLLVDDYIEITEALEALERRYRRHTIFVSGSAEEYGGWTKDAASDFLRLLGRELVGRGYRVACGFGVGVGDAVISGALDKTLASEGRRIDDSLVMRPFPQAIEDKQERDRLWEKYRRSMIATCGVSIVVFGNKIVDGQAQVAGGVRREFAIAKELGLAIIPVGCTGYAAEEIWREVVSAEAAVVAEPGARFEEKLLALGPMPASAEELVAKILNLLAELGKE